jgi:hypothetical protein
VRANHYDRPSASVFPIAGIHSGAAMDAFDGLGVMTWAEGFENNKTPNHKRIEGSIILSFQGSIRK